MKRRKDLIPWVSIAAVLPTPFRFLIVHKSIIVENVGCLDSWGKMPGQLYEGWQLRFWNWIQGCYSNWECFLGKDARHSESPRSQWLIRDRASEFVTDQVIKEFRVKTMSWHDNLTIFDFGDYQLGLHIFLLVKGCLWFVIQLLYVSFPFPMGPMWALLVVSEASSIFLL